MRDLILSLDEQFARLNQQSRDLIQSVPPDSLYEQPKCDSSATVTSSTEYVLRSAAAVEQCFGGITTNLWDDPFEWTLPETLSTPEKILHYLAEVEATRQRGFALFTDDRDLFKQVMTPSGESLLISLLLDTLTRAAHHLGGAQATFAML